MMHDGYKFGDHMGTGCLWFLLVAALLLIVPFWKILPRNGIPAWMAVIAIIPPLAVVLLWIVAFKDQTGSEGRDP